jgi:hypothetical protein
LDDGFFDVEELCYGVGEHWVNSKVKSKNLKSANKFFATKAPRHKGSQSWYAIYQFLFTYSSLLCHKGAKAQRFTKFRL